MIELWFRAAPLDISCHAATRVTELRSSSPQSSHRPAHTRRRVHWRTPRCIHRGIHRRIRPRARRIRLWPRRVGHGFRIVFAVLLELLLVRALQLRVLLEANARRSSSTAASASAKNASTARIASTVTSSRRGSYSSALIIKVVALLPMPLQS